MISDSEIKEHQCPECGNYTENEICLEDYRDLKKNCPECEEIMYKVSYNCPNENCDYVGIEERDKEFKIINEKLIEEKLPYYLQFEPPIISDKNLESILLEIVNDLFDSNFQFALKDEFDIKLLPPSFIKENELSELDVDSIEKIYESSKFSTLSSEKIYGSEYNSVSHPTNVVIKNCHICGVESLSHAENIEIYDSIVQSSSGLYEADNVTIDNSLLISSSLFKKSNKIHIYNSVMGGPWNESVMFRDFNGILENSYYINKEGDNYYKYKTEKN